MRDSATNDGLARVGTRKTRTSSMLSPTGAMMTSCEIRHFHVLGGLWGAKVARIRGQENYSGTPLTIRLTSRRLGTGNVVGNGPDAGRFCHFSGPDVSQFQCC